MAAKKILKDDDDVVDGKGVTEKERQVARKLATMYQQRLRIRSGKFMFQRLIPLGQKIEDSKFWIHFLKTAREVIDLDADPKDFLEAQFEKTTWLRKFPYPSQLHSEDCLLAYANWQYQRLEQDLRLRAREEKMVTDPFEREEAKLEKWSALHKVSKKRILREYPHEFSTGFLKHHRGEESA